MLYGLFQPGKAAANERGIIDTLHQQVHITTSGIFTTPPLTVAMETFGIDNIMFSIDYPYSPNEKGAQFLNILNLPKDQMEQLAHGNADKLLKLC